MFKRKRAVGGYATAPGPQGLLAAADRATGDQLMTMDGFLHTYHHDAGIDWKGIWAEANRHGDRIPPFGVLPYWTPRGPGGAPRPLSTLAFMGASSRLRIAQDPSTAPVQTILGLMAGDMMATGRPNQATGDPDPRVFQAAARAYKGVRL